MRSLLASLVALMGASFSVNGANSSIATMIALLVAANGGT
jgi:hypothetical protein